MAPRKRIKIRAQEPEMDRERVLDLLGSPFEGDYVGGSAEWLKNSLDHSIRTSEVVEPVILFRISTPRNRRSEWVMECVDFIGTTYDEINEHLKMWGSEIAASRGRTDWAGFGGHGNGGKFHMRQNFETSEFITYRDGHLTVFGFDTDRRYGFDETYKGEVVDPDLALKVADIDPESLPVPEEIKERLKSGDPARCRFTVVRGRGFTQVQRWRKRETFGEKLQAHGQAKQVLDRAHVIYVSDNEVIDSLKPLVIPSRTGYEDGREVAVPSTLEFDGETYQLTTEDSAGSLILRVAEEPFRRNDPSHMIDVRGKHGLVIATYRVTELPLRNRVGADFIYGEMSCVALDDLGLRQNDRAKLVPTEITDALLIWLADRIDELSDELAEAENRQRRDRDVQATLELSNRLNRWKNRFLKAREIFVEVGEGLGTGEGGSGGGGGAGPTRTGDGGEGGGGNEGTGAGEGGAGSDTGGGGSGVDRRRAARFPTILVSGYDPDPDTRRAARFPTILVSGYDPDPDTQEKFDLHPRQPVVYQRIDDIDRNLWWVNAQRPLAERIINEEPEGADSSRWRDYVFNRFVEVIQAYDVRERWDGTTDLAEYQWRLEGDIHDSAAAELADVLFGPEGLSGTASDEDSEGEELGASHSTD